MLHYRLADADRERFGCAEWLPYSVLDITIDDLEELSDRFGFDPTEWPTPYLGELTLEQAGDPDAKPVPPRWQMRAAVWQILRQNGHDVSWDDVGTVRAGQVLVRREEGKDPEPSPGSATSTTPPSGSSSTSRKRTSTA